MRKNNARPNIPEGTHPVERGRYLLMTPVIELFYDSVCQWISNRAPGGMIYGRPRLGKSTAIRYLTKILPARFGDTVPILTFLCKDYKVASEKVFFSDMLDAVGHEMLTGDSTARRIRLRNYLYQIAHKSGQDRLILFVDEAQKLHEQHYRWLMDVSNELDKLRVTLIVLLVGQEELIHQYTAFSLADKAQIIGRFMVHRSQFTGLKSEEDFLACLTKFDEDSEYPEGSGWSYTRYFFPDAFQLGWRLATSSKDLWKAFNDINDTYGRPGQVEVPMQYFCRTVEYVLLSPEKDRTDIGISIDYWKEAIIASGYIDLEMFYAGQEKPVE